MCLPTYITAFPIAGTQIVFLIAPEIGCPALVHNGAAVGTEHHAGEHTHFSHLCGSAPRLPCEPCCIGNRLRPDGFVGILKNLPFAFRIVQGLFTLVGFFTGFEINCVPQVFTPAVHDVGNRRRIPSVRRTFLCDIGCSALARIVSSRSKNFSFRQFSCNLRGSQTIHDIETNFINYLGGFFILHPLLFVIRRFHVSIRRQNSQMFSCIAFHFHNGTDFFAGVFSVPFIDDIAEGHKLVVTLSAVHTIIHRNKVNIMFGKHDFRIYADLQIITSET